MAKELIRAYLHSHGSLISLHDLRAVGVLRLIATVCGISSLVPGFRDVLGEGGEREIAGVTVNFCISIRLPFYTFSTLQKSRLILF